MQTQFTTIEGLNIRYASSIGDFKENILLLSPMPESLLTYTPMWGKLAEKYNLLAVDLPGFGKSESRQDLYSTNAMADFIIKVIDHFNFKSAHIIGPDIGTPIALFASARHPEKIKSIIISGAACVYPINATNVLKAIIEAPNLDGFKALSPRDVVNGSLSELKNYSLPDEIREDYIASYENGRLVSAMQILNNYNTDVPELDKHIEHIAVPVQIIWGINDPIAPVENAYELQKRLPKSKLNVLENIGHYTWEESWQNFLAISLDWLNEGY